MNVNTKGNRKNIVIVAYQYSVVMKSFERKLRDLKYEVELLLVMGNFDEIAKKALSNPLFLVYLPKDFSSDGENIVALMTITDIINQAGADMILLGEKDDYVDVMMQVPQAGDYEWVNRPLKMDEFALTIMRHTQIHAKRILIVDDDPAYAKMLREWLKEEYSTFVITDGSQVLKALRQKPVDLILLDYEMPIMNGPEVFEMIKGDEEFHSTPVVFLTGVAGKEEVERVMALQPQGYILKTNTKEKVLEYIKSKI